MIPAGGLARILPGLVAAPKDRQAMSVKQKAVKNVDDNDVKNGVGRQNGLCHGNPKESRIGIYRHEIIEAPLVRRDAKNPGDNKPQQDQQCVKGGAQSGSHQKIFMSCGQVSGKYGG